MVIKVDGTDREDKQMSAWLVCVIAVLAAVLLWLAWTHIGVRYAHGWINSQAAMIQASRPTAPASAVVPQPGSEPEKALAEMAQVGDTYGGLNSLLTAIAGALVFWAGFMQNRALRDSQKRESAERKARDLQAAETAKALMYAKQANDIASESRRDELRPWLKIEAVPTDLTLGEGDEIFVTVLMKMTNLGRGPAMRVIPSLDLLRQSLRSVPISSPSPDPAVNMYVKPVQAFIEEIDTPATYPTLLRVLPGETVSVNFALSFNLSEVQGTGPGAGLAFVHLLLGANYSAIYEQSPRFTVCDVYMLMNKGKAFLVDDLKAGAIFSSGLSIAHMPAGAGVYS